MGSLPNLHELGKLEGEEQGYRPGPALGHLCGGCNGTLTQAEKSKILHRFSGHNRITKARSNPQESNKIIYDEFPGEHSTYSPMSARSRLNLHLHGNVRRRDSINSSIGATSVRRLLAVVRGGTHGGHNGRGGCGTASTKKILIINLVVICFSHLFSTVAFLPFLALQSSVSVWYQPVNEDVTTITTGSLFVASSFAIAAVVALIAPCILKRIDASVTIAICNGAMILFYLSHLYQFLYVTIPAYLLLGLIQGMLTSSHISFLLILSQRITSLFHEEDEEGRLARRTVIVRRVARAFRGSNDFGLIVGSVLSAMLITCTVNLKTNGQVMDNSTYVLNDCPLNSSYPPTHCQNTTNFNPSSLYDYSAFLDDIFDKSEDGRLCGAQACPVSSSSTNSTLMTESGFRILPSKSADILIGVYGAMCGVALILSILGLDRIKMPVYQDPLERGEAMAAIRAVKESFRDPRLQMAAPLAIFIGIEQAFMYAGFSKSYVVCTLGIHRLNLVFLAMGVLQSIAACTLSMFLRTIRRYYVVGVGFTFHGCLLMVLILWNPTEDDPALFYVISASWGVCNAIWEMLSFTFLTGQYTNNWEAAFANSIFFKFLGLSLFFGLHGLLCNVWKLYSLSFLLVVAVVSFAWLEVRLENVRKVKHITRL
ncbi:unnamed protein product [Psylliodes chrysocephalus]|uniref:UNC93-like protein n=1 Tax=Psylliodes chrysocephalus TaxID=3402493 RepID=A0A9P0D186_9CUCU|nr:unnamed protein product [Psylliodes chrysocephala]